MQTIENSCCCLCIWELNEKEDLSRPCQESAYFDNNDCFPREHCHIYHPLTCFIAFSKALLDNYEADENLPEKPSAIEQLEEDAFINAITVNGGPIQIAFNYLKSKGKVSAGVSLDIFFLFTFR